MLSNFNMSGYLGTDLKSVPLKPQSRGQSKITPIPATDWDNEDFTLTPKSRWHVINGVRVKILTNFLL